MMYHFFYKFLVYEKSVSLKRTPFSDSLLPQLEKSRSFFFLMILRLVKLSGMDSSPSLGTFFFCLCSHDVHFKEDTTTESVHFLIGIQWSGCPHEI